MQFGTGHMVDNPKRYGKKVSQEMDNALQKVRIAEHFERLASKVERLKKSTVFNDEKRTVHINRAISHFQETCEQAGCWEDYKNRVEELR